MDRTCRHFASGSLRVIQTRWGCSILAQAPSGQFVGDALDAVFREDLDFSGGRSAVVLTHPRIEGRGNRPAWKIPQRAGIFVHHRGPCRRIHLRLVERGEAGPETFEDIGIIARRTDRLIRSGTDFSRSEATNVFVMGAIEFGVSRPDPWREVDLPFEPPLGFATGLSGRG